MRRFLIPILALAAAAPAAAAGAKKAAVECPVMKHRIEITKQTPSSTYQGKTYYFCCAACKPQFDKNPAKFVKAKAGKPAGEARKKADAGGPVCPVMKHAIGGKVTASTPKSTYQGKTYYFCCPACKPQFDKNPAKYVQAKAGA